MWRRAGAPRDHALRAIGAPLDATCAHRSTTLAASHASAAAVLPAREPLASFPEMGRMALGLVLALGLTSGCSLHCTIGGADGGGAEGGAPDVPVDHHAPPVDTGAHETGTSDVVVDSTKGDALACATLQADVEAARIAAIALSTAIGAHLLRYLRGRPVRLQSLRCPAIEPDIRLRSRDQEPLVDLRARLPPLPDADTDRRGVHRGWRRRPPHGHLHAVLSRAARRPPKR